MRVHWSHRYGPVCNQRCCIEIAIKCLNTRCSEQYDNLNMHLPVPECHAKAGRGREERGGLGRARRGRHNLCGLKLRLERTAPLCLSPHTAADNENEQLKEGKGIY